MPATSRKWRAFKAPLRECPRRFSLEIKNYEVIACVQHLAEMVIAMGPRLRGSQPGGAARRGSCLAEGAGPLRKQGRDSS